MKVGAACASAHAECGSRTLSLVCVPSGSQTRSAALSNHTDRYYTARYRSGAYRRRVIFSMSGFTMTNSSKTRLLASIGTIGAVLGGTALWFTLGTTPTQGSNTASAPSATPAAVAAVERRDVALWEEFSGRLEAIDR